jgi:hypothetical protein
MHTRHTSRASPPAPASGAAPCTAEAALQHLRAEGWEGRAGRGDTLSVQVGAPRLVLLHENLQLGHAPLLTRHLRLGLGMSCAHRRVRAVATTPVISNLSAITHLGIGGHCRRGALCNACGVRVSVKLCQCRAHLGGGGKEVFRKWPASSNGRQAGLDDIIPDLTPSASRKPGPVLPRALPPPRPGESPA